MRKIDKRLDARIKLARPLLARAATLTLPYHERCKSRFAATLDSGEEVALLLPRGTVLAHDDVLVADDGGLVRVIAAPEAVLRVRAGDADDDPDANPDAKRGAMLKLVRAAYHLGNRHTPVQIAADYLQLEADPVLRQMLEGIGMQVQAVEAPFQPEAGAYGGGHRHGHDASFAEDYALAQQVYAEHEPGHDHGGHRHDDPHGHDHPHGHGHGHAHGHAHEHDHGGHEHTHAHDPAHPHDNGHDHDCDACGHDHSAPGPHAHR